MNDIENDLLLTSGENVTIVILSAILKKKLNLLIMNLH